MCGLVGVAGLITDKQEKVYKTLLMLDTIRGMDSTGTAFVAEDGSVDVVKVVGHSFELLDYLPHSRRMARRNMVLLGHNRSATVGNITKSNAHPFEYDHVVGAHNGTLHNKHELPNGHAYNVDSQALFATMDNLGVHDTIRKLRGAWALSFWDKDEKTLNLIRNKERPLFYAVSKFNNTLYWASEGWMLNVACSKNGVDIEKIEEISEDTLYTFSYNPVKGLSMAKEEGLKGAAPFPVVTGQPNGHSVTRGTTTTNGPSTKPSEPLDKTRGWVAGLFSTPNFEVLCQLVVKDTDGATYVSCVNDKYPYTEFRLYLNRKDGDPQKYVGRRIVSIVGKFHQGKTAGYYKLDYSAHRWVMGEEKAKPAATVYYKDVSGIHIPREDWMKKHGTCDYCGSSVFPEEGFAFAKQGDEVLCHNCLSDPELAPFVNKVI